MNIPGQDVLVALQQGIAIDPRPFSAMAASLGADEDGILGFAEQCRKKGMVRRFGAVFDTRRLGYRSALCAVRAPGAEADRLAAALVPLAGVTHCYERLPFDFAAEKTVASCFPNLWFTLSCPEEAFDGEAERVRVMLAPAELLVMPAVRRYKVDVVFGGATRARDESVTDDSPPDATGRAIIRAMQGDTEIRSDYYAALAAKIGIPEWDLLSRLEMWRRSGRLKRIGLLLAHRNAGWSANGMCCWRVEGDTAESGRALAASDEVTHCYERPPHETFPYNLYAMVHARSMAEAAAAFGRLETATGLSGGAMLVSGREYKKTSMTFYQR